MYIYHIATMIERVRRPTVWVSLAYSLGCNLELQVISNFDSSIAHKAGQDPPITIFKTLNGFNENGLRFGGSNSG